MQDSAILEQALQAERESLEEERGRLKEQVAKGEERLREIDLRLTHVYGLMSLNNGHAPVSVQVKTPTKTPVADIAFEILSERNGETMYYKDLAAEVKTRGGELPNENAAQNLVARLVNDDRFVRPVRKGFYGLRQDYPKAQNVGERKKTRRPRRSRQV